jgi:hypothetical protein
VEFGFCHSGGGDAYEWRVNGWYRYATMNQFQIPGTDSDVHESTLSQGHLDRKRMRLVASDRATRGELKALLQTGMI